MQALERLVVGQPIIEALVPLPASTELGAGFAAKQILELAVLLLGATIDARQVVAGMGYGRDTCKSSN